MEEGRRQLRGRQQRSKMRASMQCSCRPAAQVSSSRLRTSPQGTRRRSPQKNTWPAARRGCPAAQDAWWVKRLIVVVGVLGRAASRAAAAAPERQQQQQQQPSLACRPCFCTICRQTSPLSGIICGEGTNETARKRASATSALGDQRTQLPSRLLPACLLFRTPPASHLDQRDLQRRRRGQVEAGGDGRPHVLPPAAAGRLVRQARGNRDVQWLWQRQDSCGSRPPHAHLKQSPLLMLKAWLAQAGVVAQCSIAAGAQGARGGAAGWAGARVPGGLAMRQAGGSRTHLRPAGRHR